MSENSNDDLSESLSQASEIIFPRQEIGLTLKLK